MKKLTCTAIVTAALFSLGLLAPPLAAAQTATPATPPAKADKGQAMKSKDKAAKKTEGDKGRASAMEQGKKKGMDDGKKKGLDKAPAGQGKKT